MIEASMGFFNDGLATYERVWDTFDLLISMKPIDYNFSVRWRLEAEQKMRIQTGSGMSDEEVLSFVSWYWKVLHPAIYVPIILNKSMRV